MIIVFGSLNIDMLMPVGHFPKPGETVLCETDYLSNPGGKGSNQAVAAARAGAKVAMVGTVGDDAFGRRCVSNLKQQSVLASGIALSDRPTGCATIAVDTHGENFVISAPGANMDATADQIPDELLTPSNIILTQMEVTPSETLSVLARARALGAMTILNLSPSRDVPKEYLSNVDYLIVNEVESFQLAQLLGIFGSDAEDVAGSMARMFGLTCIITLEDKGSIAARGDEVYKIQALPVEVLDSTGAGDTFCGVFAACLQAGQDWLRALHHASAGASLSCLGFGAQDGIPTMDEIKRNLDQIPVPQKIS